MLLGGVVDQNVEPAEFLDRQRNGIRTKFWVSNVPRQNNAALPELLDFSLSLLSVVMLVEINDRYVCAFFGIRNRYSPTDSTVAARDQRRHFAQLAGCPIVGSVRFRPGRIFDSTPGCRDCCCGGRCFVSPDILLIEVTCGLIEEINVIAGGLKCDDD